MKVFEHSPSYPGPSTYVLICANPATRGFQKCETQGAGVAVTDTFKRSIQRYGLGQDVVVGVTNCMRICEAGGAGVAIVSTKPFGPQHKNLMFFSQVQPTDVDNMTQTYLKS